MDPDKQHESPEETPQMPIESRPPRQLRPFEHVPADADGTDAERQERIDYLRSIAPQPKPTRKWLRILLIVLGTAIALLLMYALVAKVLVKNFSKKDANQPAQNTTQNDTQTPVTTKTKHFDSASLGLGFDYPDTWKASETNSKVAVTSDAMRLKPANGNQVNGQVTITIQSKQAALDAFKKGNGLAALTSEHVSYTKPSQTQRAQTYLTFVQYPTTTISGIDSIYITGDNGYQKDQAVPEVDVVKGDPLVTVTFVSCKDSQCAGGGTPLTLSSSMWSDATSVAKMIRSLLVSLTIQ